MILLFSLAINLAPQQTLGLQSSSVNSIWEDLFGPNSDEVLDITTSKTDSTSNRMFIQITGIDGESIDKNHKDWIEVLSFSFGMSNLGGRATAYRSGQTILDDLVLVKKLDKSSPKIMEKCAKGEVIPSLVLDVCTDTKEDSVLFYRYELKNVIISNFYCDGSTDDVVPVETFTLNFVEIKVIYTVFDSVGKSKGEVEFTWAVE